MPVYHDKLGFRDNKGKVVRKPTRYANGEFYSAFTNPTPTLVNIDENYFVVIPPGLRLTDEAYIYFVELIKNGGKEAGIELPPEPAPLKDNRPAPQPEPEPEVVDEFEPEGDEVDDEADAAIKPVVEVKKPVTRKKKSGNSGGVAG